MGRQQGVAQLLCLLTIEIWGQGYRREYDMLSLPGMICCHSKRMGLCERLVIAHQVLVNSSCKQIGIIIVHMHAL